ncbi:MAG: hypothetical protein J7L55_03230 [Desulfurococcales archaeon]|nr:hypothetical protein [Desulfurococcales archaeon]
MLSVVVEDKVRRIHGVNVQGLECFGVSNSVRPDIVTYLLRVSHEVADLFRVVDVKNHPHIKALRSFMWRVKLDPTKTRPSPEALLRRALRKGFIPTITPLVDIGNAVSLKSLVPVSVIDADKVEKPLILRYSLRGERFMDFRGNEVRLKGHEVVLADSAHRLFHLLPYRDGFHGRIGEGTTHTAFLAYGVNGIPEAAVRHVTEEIRGLVMRFFPEASCKEMTVHV